MEDEDRIFYIEYFCDLMQAKKRSDFTIQKFKELLIELN